jgi:hypothetical protein
MTRSIFQTLSRSSVLRTLELSQVNVGPSNQRVVLSIPSLRKLVLRGSTFIPTAVYLPSTSIDTLILKEIRLSRAIMEHLFRILADTLETFHVASCCSGIGILPDRVQLRHLKSLGIPERMLQNESLMGNPFFSQPTITTLFVEPGYPSLPPSLPSFLPQLCRLSAPLHIAKALVHGRPIQDFRHIQLTWIDTNDLESSLSWLTRSIQHIKELELCLDIVPPGFLESLSKYTPHLRRLCVVLKAGSKWRDVREGLRIGGATMGSGHGTLKELEFRMEIPANSYSPRQLYYGRPTVLHLLIDTCAVIELMRVTIISLPVPGSRVEHWNMPVYCLFKLWKLPNGQWQDRVFEHQGGEYE